MTDASTEVEKSNEGLSDSEFNMWRALFSLVHGDGVVAKEERDFMWNAMEENNFSASQREILEFDMKKPAGVELVFLNITEQADRVRFFDLARKLCWCDGDFDQQEQEIMSRLEKLHIKKSDFNEMIKTVKFELESTRPERNPDYDPMEHVVKDGFFSRLFFWKS